MFQGLALINGTQFITSIGVEALERSINICNTATVVAALSLEVLKGTTKAFDECMATLSIILVAYRFENQPCLLTYLPCLLTYLTLL